MLKQTTPTADKTERLPLRYGFPVDVQIRLHVKVDGYDADIQVGRGKVHRLSIEISPKDVEDLNLKLQQTFEKVQNRFQSGEKYGKEQQDGLRELAVAGKYVFNHIFAEGPNRDIVTMALEAGSMIQFSSESFFVPWDLLYDKPIGNECDISGFWGMRYIVSRAIIQRERSGDFAPEVIQSQRPRVGMITCRELENVKSREIPALKSMSDAGLIRLSILPDLNQASQLAGLKRFGGFLREEREIVHLACHAYEKNPAMDSYLKVEESFPVSLLDFDTNDYALAGSPLVILNACRTGTMHPGHASNWASQFWRRGARGVVATEVRVPDWFAASFAEELYKRLLSNTPLGESLLETRRHLWDSAKNPLGLAYALYSSPLIQFETVARGRLNEKNR
jgi:hypothetical protein